MSAYSIRLRKSRTQDNLGSSTGSWPSNVDDRAVCRYVFTYSSRNLVLTLYYSSSKVKSPKTLRCRTRVRDDEHIDS